MKVLVLAKYGLQAASTRHRFAQYFPALREAGFEPELSPLFGDDYLSASFAGRSRLRPVLSGAGRRIADFFRAGAFDLVLLNYEINPFVPALYEQLLALRVPLVVDLDDAFFHRYDTHPLFRPLLGHKIERVAGMCRLAIAGNDYLAARLRQRQPDVRVIPTVVDTTLYLPLLRPASRTPVIGWIGSPSTAPSLGLVKEALAEVAAGGRANLVAVGAGLTGAPAGFASRPWSEEREIADLQSFDIGIMPLPNDAWSRGKCGFKLIQYMACGLPVVASPVGVNREIVVNGETGFLAESIRDWKEALLRLLESAALRSELGAAGRERAVREYSLARWSGAFVQALRDASCTL